MYFLRESLRNFFRHRRANAVAVVVIAMGMLLVGGIGLSYVNFRNLEASWGGQVHIVIYLRDDVSPQGLEALRHALSQGPETASLEFTSKEQALHQFKARLGEGADILEGLQTNPLPASFTLKVRDEHRSPELLRAMVGRYRTLPEIEGIDYGERWVERFHLLVWVLRIGVLGVGGVISMAVMLIIANTVRLALYARAEEIEIMRLVGATAWFIKLPFFLEGVLQGLLGTGVALGLLYGLFSLVLTWLRPMAELFVDLSFLQFLPPQALAALILGGTLLGGLGSMVSLRRTDA